ncbi:hypothetical protein D3C76_1293060 [compost metagenome]
MVLNAVNGGTLDFARVFNDEHTFIRVVIDHFLNNGVDESCLARAGATDHKNVLVVAYSLLDGVTLRLSHDPLFDIAVEREDCDGGFTDRKARRRNHWRELAGKSFIAERQFAVKDWLFCPNGFTEQTGERLYD